MKEIGAQYLGQNKCKFTVWAPNAKKVDVKISAPIERIIPMKKTDFAYYEVTAEDINPGTEYLYRIDGSKERPDPASHYQPFGVHKSSAVIDHSAFPWTDKKWLGIPLEKMIMYELHIGTFTSEGSFEAAISRLDELADLGINAIEIMPVAQFPGSRNWGYDGVFPFAVQNSYGGPHKFKELIDAAHFREIAVILDVVYNHLGPEGNYLLEYAPYFTDKYKTPWGQAVNFDAAHSDHVRNYFIQNALHWLEHYHIDALRLDALHAIFDMSAKHFFTELSEQVDAFSQRKGRQFYLIGESGLNDSNLIRPRDQHGDGIHSQWLDDYHHCVHTLITDEKDGYYTDYGKTKHLAKSLREGFVYSWQYSPHRLRHHGNSSADIPADKFVVFSQNHDQIGNRLMADRLVTIAGFEAAKLAAGAIMLSPYIPLLYMGQEYAEKAPFNYFVEHSDQELIEAVRKGRKEEFSSFNWKKEPPDPQSPETFQQSILNWNLRNQPPHSQMLELYRDLIALRRQIPALAKLSKDDQRVDFDEDKKLISTLRSYGKSTVFCTFNFADKHRQDAFELPAGKWKKLIDSAEKKYAGQGSDLPELITGPAQIGIKPFSFTAFELKS